MSGFIIRPAKEEDCEEIMKMIIELAQFEKMEDQVEITVDVLKRDGFGEERGFECLVAERTTSETGKVKQRARGDGSGDTGGLIGYILFYYIYSTWVGRCCYMEDLYVTPDWRGKGIGTAMWVEVTKIALAKGCSRMQWAVLEWNKSSVELYKRRGSINLTETEAWHLFRMTKPVMEDFAAQHKSE